MGTSPISLAILLLALQPEPSAQPAPTPGAEVGGRATLDQAKRAIADLEYDQAAILLREVIIDTSLDEPTLLEARWHLGAVEVVRGTLSEAKLHFEWILERDAEYVVPPEEPQKVVGFWERTKVDFLKQKAEQDRLRAEQDERRQQELEEARRNLPQAPPPEAEGLPVLPLVAGGVIAALGVVVVVAGASAAGGVAYWMYTSPSLGYVDFTMEGSS